MTENLPNGRSGSIQLNVVIQDNNDNNPIFVSSGYQAIVPEGNYAIITRELAVSTIQYVLVLSKQHAYSKTYKQRHGYLQNMQIFST